jgi:predicted DNA-binding transcriptional regulator AlpA
MPEYSFILAIDGDVEEKTEELFEAGCDDALFGSIDGAYYADFDREAPTLGEAISSAIADVESVPGLQVRRVEPDDLVTMSEIAERLGRSRESVRLLITGDRGPGDFPPPVSHLRSRNRLWRWSDVAEWSFAGKADPEDLAKARLIAAVNAALDLRIATPGLPESERDLVGGFR